MASSSQSDPKIEDETTALHKEMMALYRMTPEEAEKEKKHSKDSIYTLDRLKLMAIQLELPKTKPKGDLIDMIRTKIRDRAAVAALARSSAATAASRSTPKSFQKGIHTFPRLCNIVMMDPEGLQSTTNLATRMELQFRETGARHLVWRRIADDFNNPSYPVGPLVTFHENFVVDGEKMDPENVDNLGISPEIAADLFSKVLTQYKESVNRHTQSGHHDEEDFPKKASMFLEGHSSMNHLPKCRLPVA
jgi:hypothetical protein